MVAMDSPAVGQLDEAVGVTSSLVLPMIAGNYYTPFGVGVANDIQAEGRESGRVFIPARSCTLDRLGVHVTSAGTSGAVVRLGLRSWDTATGLPGAVLVDGGTADATGTGLVEVTISQAVTAGTPYFLTAVIQGGAGTRPTIVCNSGAEAWPLGDVTTSSTADWHCNVTDQHGALADDLSWNVIGSYGFRIWVRASA